MSVSLSEAKTSANDFVPGRIILIAGITGTGKTNLSLELARALAKRNIPAEIINADAMQLYRGMDIGTAKLSEAERAEFPHHLFDILEADQSSTVADYQKQARETILQIQSRGATPIMVGGSGLYISAVLNNFEFPGSDPEIRANLEAEAEQFGLARLYQRLAQLDPKAAEKIGSTNARRVIRALEVIELSGENYRAELPEAEKVWQSAIEFFLDGNRELIRERLRLRVEKMWQQGLLAETETLLKSYPELSATAAKAIGYAQAAQLLAGELSEEEATEQIWQLTVRYARRQRSWFNRNQEITRLDFTDPDLLSKVLNRLGLKEIVS